MDSFLKPEITAPGVGIFAARMASGTGGVSIGGTSMAAPHVAGVAGLRVQAYPHGTPETIKAAMMNTAVDLADGSPIPRSGAGRVDGYGAVETSVVAVGDPDLVGLNWGVDFSRQDVVTRIRQVTLRNTGTAPESFEVDWAFQLGATGSMTVGAQLDVEPSTVAVAAGGYGYLDWILQGIVDAADDGVHVIDMSLGGWRFIPEHGPESYLAYARGTQYAWGQGTLVVA